jgi:hypothetical protein
VECELPNSRIHQFSGVIRWDDGSDRQTPVDEVSGRGALPCLGHHYPHTRAHAAGGVA